MLTSVERAVLQDARDLIADEKHWCPFALATGPRGEAVEVDDVNARRWCALGALMKASAARGYGCWFSDVVQSVVRVTDAHGAIAFPDMFRDSARLAPSSVTITINNGLGHDAILTVFDKALADETIGDA